MEQNYCGSVADIISGSKSSIENGFIVTSMAQSKRSKSKKSKISTVDDDTEEELDINENEESSEEEKSLTEENKLKRQRNYDHDARTVFVGNLPPNVKKLKLKKWFSRFGEVDTVRIHVPKLHSTKVPKKLTAMKEEFINKHKHSLHGHVRFIDSESALKALEANGTLFNNTHHIRVDKASNKGFHNIDKSIFLGNLPFRVEEEEIRHLFKDCGKIENIRIIRDDYTGIGKGIGYINFENEDSVQLALQLDGIELNKRLLRVKKTSNKPKKPKGIASKIKNGKTVNSAKNLKHKVSRENAHSKVNLNSESFQGVSSVGIKNKSKKKKLSKPAEKRKKISKILTGEISRKKGDNSKMV